MYATFFSTYFTLPAFIFSHMPYTYALVRTMSFALLCCVVLAFIGSARAQQALGTTGVGLSGVSGLGGRNATGISSVSACMLSAFPHSFRGSPFSEVLFFHSA